jgi:hypothetical protein
MSQREFKKSDLFGTIGWKYHKLNVEAAGYGTVSQGQAFTFTRGAEFSQAVLGDPRFDNKTRRSEFRRGVGPVEGFLCQYSVRARMKLRLPGSGHP